MGSKRGSLSPKEGDLTSMIGSFFDSFVQDLCSKTPTILSEA